MKKAPAAPEEKIFAVGFELQEAADCFALDAEADDAALAVDLGDRVRGDEPAAAGEEAVADRECVRNVGCLAVHRALDSADHAAPRIRYEKASGRAEVGS
jgi:hypothetical protein